MSRFILYGGNGHRTLGIFETRPEAEAYADAFELKCWNSGVAVPKSIIKEES